MVDIDTVYVRAPAKINLFLRILAREVSGYHQIETLFAAVDLCDEIYLERSKKGISLEVIGPDVGSYEHNLAYRAAQCVLESISADFGVRITLTKNIPMGAGLGGGSSDAGATLRALNIMLGSLISQSELLEFAAGLGSDVPFFVSGSGRALAWGRGERILNISGSEMVTVLLAIPSVKISTKDAYRNLDIHTYVIPSVCDHTGLGRLENFADVSINDFEESIFTRYPRLGKIREAMEDQGAILARLSGSGGTLFAIFEGQSSAESAKESMATVWPDVKFVVTQTLETQPKPTVKT
jgi:4-diphosphocytidyl-2-C-methyl-D-erythritol kinase